MGEGFYEGRLEGSAAQRWMSGAKWARRLDGRAPDSRQPRPQHLLSVGLTHCAGSLRLNGPNTGEHEDFSCWREHCLTPLIGALARQDLWSCRMFRKAIVCAVASLGLVSMARAGLTNPSDIGPTFGFVGSWADFELATSGRVTSDLKNLCVPAGGCDAVPNPDFEVPSVSVDGLRILNLQANFSDTGAGNLKTGEDNGRHAVVNSSGVTDTDGNYIENSGALVLVFDTAVKAFGFWGIDIGDFGTSGGECTDSGCGTTGKVFTVELLDAGNAVLESFDLSGAGTNGAAEYYGFLSTGGFKSVRITNTTAVDGQALSQFTSATTADLPDGNGNVPEPAGLALVSLGLLGLALRRQRR